VCSEASAFFKDNPAEPLTLVFGAGHNFTASNFDYFEGKQNVYPLVTSVGWPELVKDGQANDSLAIAGRIARAKNDTEQLELLEQAPVFRIGFFAALTTEEAQLAALPKTQVTFGEMYDGDTLSMLYTLKQMAKTARVQEVLLELQNLKLGPFRACSHMPI